ncbi:McrB family protein [Capnocytophaga sp. oral taxon 323]|jgi:ATPase associated with various cellular activities AAA_5|uniref:McrB family protein n=1 Tax=Capnocytophaga sp. oral taxon 323 TaxID=1705617 RepID=UPI0006AE8CE1|nr:AAA family ATPase [Capnocytophaga sp. oral taxon 323]ALC96522.1 ATPase [Capnocytophaga sp. oral taxon 323]
MNEKIQALISNYIRFLQEKPSNPDEVYKWQAIKHFEQHWDINAPDFYEMFKEAFRKKDNLVDYRPFGILEALGENYPTKLKELLGIVYGADDFYTKLGKCRTFTENVIDDLKEKSNTNFSTKIDERTLSFLLTLKFPNEYTFYKRDIYTKLCEYLGEVSRKERKYEHFIELLTEITTYFNNPELKHLTSNFIPQGFDEPLLLAQDIVYQNMTISSEKAFRNVLDKIPKHWASVFFYKLGNIIEDLALGDTENQVFSVRLDEKSLRYHIGKRICLSVSPKEFLFITGREVDIPKLRREEFERPNNAFLYYQGTPQHIETYYPNIKNAVKEEIALDKETYPKSYDNSYFREYVFEKKYKVEFETIESNMTNQAIKPTIIDLLHYKHQIILQGPPGTGKTREAKRIAKQLLGLNDNDSLEGNEQFKLIQFHPSYSYEDFVRGIVAQPNETSGGIVYTAENKVLAEFAKEALTNYLYSDGNIKSWINNNFDRFKREIQNIIEKENKYILDEKTAITNIKEEEFLLDNTVSTIDFNFFKKLIEKVIEENFEITAKNTRDLLGVEIRYSNYKLLIEKFLEKYIFHKSKLKNYVFIIDEINRANLSTVLGELIYALEYRGESVESMYALDDTKESRKIILPPNLYIIGTMNTADRSVGHIDYAIRRRFAFVNMLPKELEGNFDKNLFKAVSKLFIENYDEYINNTDTELKRAKTLSPEFKPEDVWLGQSYFIQKKYSDGKDVPMSIRWEYEIKPILLEYIKDGILIDNIKIEEQMQEIKTLVYENNPS